MSNICIFPKDLVDAIALCKPLCLPKWHNSKVYRTTDSHTNVPANLTKHRFKFTRVANKLYAKNETRSEELTVLQLRTKLGAMQANKPVTKDLINKLLNSHVVTSPATESEVQAYIEAERRLTAWRLEDRAKTEGRRSKMHEAAAQQAVKLAAQLEKLQAQAARERDLAMSLRQLAQTVQWSSR